MAGEPTVVICTAGVGSRLGASVPKSLVELRGRRIIEWQLDLLVGVRVVVVVGYKAELVRDLVGAVRPDVTFAVNSDFRETGTAASLAIGAQSVSGDVLSLDGDLLVAPKDMAAFLEHQGTLLGITSRASTMAVGVELDAEATQVTSMGFDVESSYEWSGLVRFGAELGRSLGRGHVFESLLPSLPMPVRRIDCVEIDEPEDVLRAEGWLAARTSAKGGMWTGR